MTRHSWCPTKGIFRPARNQKDSLAVPPGPPHVPDPNPAMTQRLLLTSLCLAALLSSGCLFSKKTAAPKENPSIPGSVEESLRQRWVDKRVGELVAQGKTAEAARVQAAEEFRERYGYTGAAQKK